MTEQTTEPWSFTIEFDEAKAKLNGYDINMLYDYVGKNIEKYGNERVSRRTWRAIPGHDEADALTLAISALSRRRWVMQNVKSLTCREDEQDICNVLDTIRRVTPERICD